MANFKFVKSATAAVLGASVLTTAVVVPGADASAKTTYKVNKNGTLVNAKTNKAVKGYKTYKGKLYKNGKKFTGKTSSGVYYVKGKKFTGKTKYGYYYVNGKRFTGTTKYGYYYVNGKRFNGTTKYGNLYVDGKRYTGTTKYGYTYYNGKRVEGEYKGKVYANGKKYTGVYKDKLYKNGVLNVGLYLHNGKLYEDAGLNEGKDLYKEVLYDGATPNKGLALYEGKLYNDSALATGYVTFDEKLYNDGALFTGEKDGVEYKDGVVVKYEVTSVKAINASEIQLTFSEPVSEGALDEANYEIEVNGTKLTSSDFVAGYASQVSSSTTVTTDSSVILRLNSGKELTAADKVVVQAKDKIKTTKGKAIERYSSDVFTFDNYAKPKLLSTSLNGNKVQFTFDRPVNVNTGIIKVDGVALSNTATDLVAVKAIPGDYTYETTASVSADATKVGDHEVTLFDVAETALKNPEVADTLNGTYKVSQDVTAPELKSVTALNANKFLVTFSEPVKIDSLGSLVIKKGTHQYEVKTTDNTVPYADQTDAYAYISNPLQTTSATSVIVVIPEDIVSNSSGVPLATQPTTAYANPLYKDAETSVTLDVTAKNYKDAVNLVGAETTKQVTLSQDATTPTVVEENNAIVTKDASNKISAFNVAFNGNITKANAATFADNVVVKNSQGVIIPQNKYTANVGTGADSKLVKITAIDSAYQDTSYTVTFKKETVKYVPNLTSVTDYNAEDAANKELTTTIGVKADGNAKYYTYAGTPSVTATKNVFELNYGVALSDSALDAANYTLDGKALPAGTKVEFFDSKKQVRITLPEQSIKSSTDYKLAISTNVKTEAGQSIVKDLKSLDVATVNVKLQDNISPKITGAEYIVSKADSNSTKTIKVTFSEKLKATDKDDFKVLVAGATTPVDVTSATVGTGDEANTVTLKLTNAVNTTQSTAVTLVKGANKQVDTKDLSEGNEALVDSTATASTKTVDGTGAITAEENTAAVAADKAALAATATISANGNVTLPTTGSNGSTISWAIATDASNVAALTGNTATFTRSAADDADDTVTFTATITKGAATDTKVVTYTVKEAKAPTVTTKLPAAGDITTTGTKTIVFSEALDTASKAVVKSLVDAAFTANGTATVSSAWETDNKTLTVTIGGTVDATTNKVVLATLAPAANFKVTDLNGNDSAVLAAGDLQ
ncbi:immunoglobulin-like domain-containing protein [Rummeliibacillus suwonensis]|uniref:immunoglobulin-like domain-containing protein n=1 Tax=Rummeliibacillus suwonensis TaxID=1306154 RepID=UPI0028A1AECD|nr:immunoglobulin-like domain-containing protein [Rummeliibacillus suwonensis]